MNKERQIWKCPKCGYSHKKDDGCLGVKNTNDPRPRPPCPDCKTNQYVYVNENGVIGCRKCGLVFSTTSKKELWK